MGALKEAWAPSQTHCILGPRSPPLRVGKLRPRNLSDRPEIPYKVLALVSCPGTSALLTTDRRPGTHPLLYISSAPRHDKCQIAWGLTDGSQFPN